MKEESNLYVEILSEGVPRKIYLSNESDQKFLQNFKSFDYFTQKENRQLREELNKLKQKLDKVLKYNTYQLKNRTILKHNLSNKEAIIKEAREYIQTNWQKGILIERILDILDRGDKE
jgi:ElaB/YqjD/DUF883 family membrane-anchored ribosome-binding protein